VQQQRLTIHREIAQQVFGGLILDRKRQEKTGEEIT
jgi:hypothetical protein